MITVKQFRDRGNEHFEQATLTFNNPLEAVVHLAKAELGWGGQIVDVDENHIKVQTRVLNCLDTSIFEGSAEEMKPLFEFAYFYMETREKYSNLIVDETVDYIQCLPNEIGGVPLFLSILTPFLIGGNRLKVAVMLACGMRDEKDIKAGLSAKIDDLVAAVQLSKEGRCSFREALAI